MAWEPYWVDSENGSDSNDGLSLETAWRTAAKVTAMAAANPFLFRTEINIVRGSNFTTPFELAQQGSPFTWLRIKAVGDPSKPRPKFTLASATVDRAGIWLDSCFAVHIDEIDVDGGKISSVSCIGAANLTAPERAFPLHVTNAELTNSGLDLVTVSASNSSLNDALGFAMGSNHQGRGYLIENVVGDSARRNGFNFFGVAMGVRINRFALTDLGDHGLAFHDGGGFVDIGEGTVDGCIDGVHARNWGSASGRIDGLKVRNASGSLLLFEMWKEDNGDNEARVDWNVFNFVGDWPATATGAAAVVFGRQGSGSLISGRLWNSTIVNKRTNAPTIYAEFIAEAQTSECFLDVRNCALQSAGGKHAQIVRNGRTPWIKFSGNRYNVEGSLWTLDGTSYALTAWRALSDDLRLMLDNDASYPSSVGTLGLSGDLATDFAYAEPAAGSALPRRGENLSPTNYPFLGVDRRDAFARRRSRTRPWDIGAVATTGVDVGMDLTTLDRVKRHMRNTSSTEDDEQLSDLITSVSRRMEIYMGRDVYIEERTEYFSVSEGQQVFRLRGVPIVEVEAVYYDSESTFGDDTLLTTDQYTISPEVGQILLKIYPTFGGQRALKVVYTGGVATSVPDLAGEGYADLVQAATAQVVNDHRRMNTAADLAESTTNPAGSRSYARDGWIRSVQDVLDRYRMVDV